LMKKIQTLTTMEKERQQVISTAQVCLCFVLGSSSVGLLTCRAS
jgi:hypothetical protein